MNNTLTMRSASLLQSIAKTLSESIAQHEQLIRFHENKILDGMAKKAELEENLEEVLAEMEVAKLRGEK